MPQLIKIDKINNDSVALGMLQNLSTQNINDKRIVLQINYRIILRANTIRNFGLAIKVSNESMNIAQENGLDSMEAYFTKLLGICYYHIGQKEAAVPYFQKAAKISRQNGLWELEASCYNNIGAILTDKLEFELAESFLLRSIRIMKENGAEEKEAALRTYRVLATLYTNTGRNSKAEEMYLVLIEKGKKAKDTTLVASSLVYYSAILSKRGEYDLAVETGEQAVVLARQQNDPLMKQMALTVQSRNLYLANRYKEAYTLLEESSNLFRTTFDADLKKEVSNMEVYYQTEQIKRDKARSEERAKKQLLIYGLSFFGILVLIIFGVYVWNQRKNNRQKLVLQQQKLENLIEGEEKERLRVARDLHDGIVQDLTAIKLKLQKEKGSQVQNELLKELDHTIFEVRNIAYQMMPVALKEYGLVSALEDLVRKMAEPANIKYEFDAIDISDENGSLDPQTRFADKIEVGLYRVAQELLNNVVKHSGADFVNLTLSKHPDKLTLLCEDNGKGFDETKIKKGIGMNGLITRLALLKGTISFQPSGASGTLVIASLPLT